MKSGYSSTANSPLTNHVLDAKSRIRVVHNVANGPNVDGYFDGTKVLKGVGYKAISDYLEVPSGKHSIDVKIADTDNVVTGGDMVLAPGAAYTLIVHGLITDLKSIQPLLLKDDLSCPAPGKAHVRLVHAAASVPAADVYAGNLRIFENVSYGQVGYPAYLLVNAGAVDIAVTPHDSKTTVLGPISMKLADGAVYTVIASGLLNDAKAPFTVLVSEDTKGSCVVMMM
jgi:hypothetical protein